jgi:hypothetical protein
LCRYGDLLFDDGRSHLDLDGRERPLLDGDLQNDGRHSRRFGRDAVFAGEKLGGSEAAGFIRSYHRGRITRVRAFNANARGGNEGALPRTLGRERAAANPAGTTRCQLPLNREDGSERQQKAPESPWIPTSRRYLLHGSLTVHAYLRSIDARNWSQ